MENIMENPLKSLENPMTQGRNQRGDGGEGGSPVKNVPVDFV